MGDRVAVMRKGVLQQVDGPQRLYDLPANLFVAEFIGSPAMNLVSATLEREDDRLAAVFGSYRLTLDPALVAARPALSSWIGKETILGFRPEDLEDVAIARERRPGDALSIVVDIREDVGSEVYVHFDLDVPPVRRADVIEAKDKELVPIASPFVARLSRGTTAREREPLQVAVDTGRLYFFDPDSGDGIYS
jgi:multiple sugar transport system ATP-binding protein